MDKPVRKDIRPDDYDYSRSGAYFVTICTKNKMCIFWDNKDKYRPIPPENENLNVGTVINQFKGYVSKKSGFHVWQGRFYDRVLRNEQEYRGAWQYIENNPANWENDELFCKE